MSEQNTVDEYVAAVRAELSGVRGRDRDEALAELRALLADQATRMGESAAVHALGDPREYARNVRDALGVCDAASEDGTARPQGRVLGLPYDFRGASVDRIESRLWNPADPRIFTPRLFGVGWTINFGAIAVKLGMLRPDDVTDEAFDRIPVTAVRVVLAIPALLAAATAGLMAVSWRGLPAEVPMHWGLSGSPDDWAPKAVAFGLLAAIAVLPVVASYGRLLRAGTPARSRILSAAALSLLSAIGLGITVITVIDANGGASGDYIWVAIVAGVVLSFLLLYVPARLGLRAEWRECRVRDQRRS